MELRQLPGELLSLILSYNDSSHLVITLWKCGDSTLNAKLSKWIHFIDLQDLNVNSTSRYPKMLSNLPNLRFLRIEKHAFIAPPHMLSTELRKLSPTLEVLELAISTIELDFFLDFPSAPTEPASVHQRRKNSPPAWDISAYFPRLRRLIAGYNNSGILQLKMLHGLLPSTLEYLEINSLSDDIESVAGILPPSLETFLMRTVPHAIDYPRTLTCLGNQFSMAGFSGADVIKVLRNLPPNMKQIPSFTVDWYVAENLSLETLKPSLMSLEMELYQSIDIDWVPPALTKLHLAGKILKVPFLLTIPTVTDLLASSIDFDGIRATSGLLDEGRLKTLWPPKLEIWHFDSLLHDIDEMALDFITKHEILSSLPPSLTKIVAHGLPEFELFDWNLNFPKLRTATFSFYKTDPDLSKSLEEKQDFLANCLNIQSLTGLTIFFPTHHIEDISAEFVFKSLPRGLETLLLHGDDSKFKWSSDAWTHLPPSITDLRIYLGDRNNSAPPPSLVLQYLPSQLKCFYFNVFPAPTVAEIHSMPCYHTLRQFTLPNASYMMPQSVVAAWPEAASVPNNSQLMYPDPRVLARYTS